MAVTATRTIQIGFSGDVALEQNFSALPNATSPGEIIIQTLASGNNTITPPSVIGEIDIVALTIIPPAANTILMTLKGVAGDSGIPLHLTDPTTIALNDSFATLVINAASEILGVRLIWS